MNIIEKTCKQCKSPFKPAKPWQEFCCQKCRNAYHNTDKKIARNGGAA